MFREFYEMNCKAIPRTHFVSPEDEGVESFGRLMRPSLDHVISRRLRQIREIGISIVQVCRTVIFILILDAIFLSSLVLGVTELSIFMGAMDDDEGCDMPLKKWIFCRGIVHIISFLRKIRQICRSEEQRERQLKSISEILWNLTNLAVIIIGAIVYQASPDKCPVLLYNYCFYYVTVMLTSSGLLICYLCYSVS